MAEDGVVKFMRPKKLVLEVEQLDGTTKHLECDAITRDMGAKVAEISNNSKNSAKSLYDQMAVYFGGRDVDYANIDVRVVMQVIQWMGERLKDPT